MQKLGIVGGIGPASTLDYYSGVINGAVEKTGEYPPLVIDSIDMNEMCGYFERGEYDAAAEMLLDSINNLKNAGATLAVMASNTPHIVFDKIKASSPLPLISIIEATCGFALEMEYKKVLILGTAFTMKSGLYTKPLNEKGIEALVPSDEDIKAVHGIIFPNLERGIIVPKDKEKMIAIAERYISENAVDAVVLGCTEIPLMIKDGDLSVPAINTTRVHVEAILKQLEK